MVFVVSEDGYCVGKVSDVGGSATDDPAIPVVAVWRLAALDVCEVQGALTQSYPQAQHKQRESHDNRVFSAVLLAKR